MQVRVVVDSKNPFAREAFGEVADVVVVPTAEVSRERLRDADAVVVRSETPVGPRLLDGTMVQFVGTATIGTDHVDLSYLRSRGIGFASAPGSNANAVAEYVVTGLHVMARRLGMELSGMTLGVVGVGNVGSRVARIGRLLGMQVLENDPPLERETGRKDFVPLDALMDADIISLHVPLTRTGPDATYHLFDRRRIFSIRRGSLLLNTARGAVVESDALLDALRQDHVRAAILDVWEHEPKISTELLRQSAIGTPHIAGYSFDGKVNAVRMMYDAFCRHFGITRPWPVIAGMPAPAVSSIDLGDTAGNTQALLHDLLLRCYDIEHDDRNLRGILTVDPETRWQMFRDLRARYPVRREFKATVVTGSHAEPGFIGLLQELGFSVRFQ